MYGEHNYEVLTSAREGLQRQEDHFGSKQRHDTDGYNIIPFGYCTYRNRSDDGKFAFNINTISEKAIVSKFYPVFRFTNANSTFMAEFLNSSPRVKKKLSVLAVGTSQVVLSFEALKAAKFDLPCKDEQDKIAAFLECLNARIENQRTLVVALKKYKRGVVKAIMTKQIRFVDKNGKPYPEWSACTLQDAVDFLDGQRKPLESADRAKRQGKYPYYGASGIIDSIDDYIFDEPLILLGEDGANIINRSSPLCFIATGKYWVNNHAHVMRPHKGQNIRFLRELLESLDYTRYNTGTAQPKLNQEKCRTIPLSLPIYEEQCHIADFLAALEHKCAQENEELEGILQTKNALMQQLFI